MTALEAIVLGIVQGLTEFLPISSTAHLRIVPALVGWDDPGAAFTAVIQLGTLLACIIYFRQDIGLLIVGFFRGLRSGQPFRDPYSRMAWMIIVGTLPIVVWGLLFKKNIETNLRSLYVVSAAMIGLALFLILAEWLLERRTRAGKKGKGLWDVTWEDALLIGCAQAVALIPGSSRSGVTITAGLFCGLTREAAARFSFLLSLPAVFAAAMLELYKERETLMGSQSDAVNLGIATVVSGIVGYASIALLLRFLRTRSMWPFIIYRLLLGAALLALLGADVLEPV